MNDEDTSPDTSLDDLSTLRNKYWDTFRRAARERASLEQRQEDISRRLNELAVSVGTSIIEAQNAHILPAGQNARAVWHAALDAAFLEVTYGGQASQLAWERLRAKLGMETPKHTTRIEIAWSRSLTAARGAKPKGRVGKAQRGSDPLGKKSWRKGDIEQKDKKETASPIENS